MELLKWEDIKENEEYIDRVYGRITVHAKAIIKNEKLLNITYKDSNQFPVSFDGMKIFKEVYKAKTLEELGFYIWFSDNKEITIYANYTEGIKSLDDSVKILFDTNKNIYLASEYFVVMGQELKSVEIDRVLHKAIELKMIELGLWEEV